MPLHVPFLSPISVWKVLISIRFIFCHHQILISEKSHLYLLNRNRHHLVILGIQLFALRWAEYICVYMGDHCIYKLLALLMIYLHKKKKKNLLTCNHKIQWLKTTIILLSSWVCGLVGQFFSLGEARLILAAHTHVSATQAGRLARGCPV